MDKNEHRSEPACVVSMVCDYVVECRGKGHFLPATDIEIIKVWVAFAKTTDQLLVILDDVLPDFFAKRAHKTVPPSLRGANRLILSRLKEFSGRSVSI